MNTPLVFDRWALMQHHGAPTRLLDWTASPYVAAYFAVEQEPKADGVIYTLQPGQLFQAYGGVPERPDKGFEELVVSDKAPDRVFFFWPEFKTERFLAQQGHFSFNANILGDHDITLATSLSAIAKKLGALVFEKWIIPALLKSEFLRQLRVMNVAAHALFPGLDGLGRSVTELARLQAG